MKISLGNKKLGMIPNVNLPAIKTCRKDAPCSKTCYANKGTYQYDNIKKSYMDNLNDYLADNEKYFEDINNFLNNDSVIYKYFRWHSSGDIVNMKYLINMVKLAKANPLTKFLAFTKKYEIVNLYLSVHESFPGNLVVVFSAWDKDFKINNPFNLPVAYVDFKHKEKNPNIPELSLQCNGDCSKCKGCWNLKKGENVDLKNTKKDEAKASFFIL